MIKKIKLSCIYCNKEFEYTQDYNTLTFCPYCFTNFYFSWINNNIILDAVSMIINHNITIIIGPIHTSVFWFYNDPIPKKLFTFNTSSILHLHRQELINKVINLLPFI